MHLLYQKEDKLHHVSFYTFVRLELSSWEESVTGETAESLNNINKLKI